MFVDHYAILGVKPSATTKEIRVAFRAAARKSHPDAHPNDPTAATRFRAAKTAVDVLSDVAKRASFDEHRAAQQRRTEEHARAPEQRRNDANRRPQESRSEQAKPRGPSSAPSAAKPRSQSSGPSAVTLLFGASMILATAWVTSNSWDPDVARFRGGDGRFRGGRWS